MKRTLITKIECQAKTWYVVVIHFYVMLTNLEIRIDSKHDTTNHDTIPSNPVYVAFRIHYLLMVNNNNTIKQGMTTYE